MAAAKIRKKICHCEPAHMLVCNDSCFFLFVQHPVSDTQFIYEVAVVAGTAAQLFADVGHVDLEFFNTAVIHAAPDRADDGG